MFELNLHLKGRIRPRLASENNKYWPQRRKMIYAFRMNYRFHSREEEDEEEGPGRVGQVSFFPPHVFQMELYSIITRKMRETG